MASERRHFEIAIQLSQSWLELAHEKPSSHICRSARQAAEAAFIRAAACLGATGVGDASEGL